MLVLWIALGAVSSLPAQSALPCSGVNPFTVEMDGSTDTAVCPGQAITMTFETFDPDPQDSVFITYNHPIPGATFEITEGRLPSATFKWTPVKRDAGFHFFTVSFQDDCVPPNSRAYAISIQVRNPIIFVPEQLSVCNGDSARLDSKMVFESIHFTHYTWSPSQGVADPQSRITSFKPSTDQVYTLIATNGYCSDTISMEVLVVEMDTSVSVSLNSLVALEPDATYQWVDCNHGNTPIAGATNQSFAPAISGSYAVMLKRDSCEQISACRSIELDSLTGLVAFDFFPNPASGTIHLITQANQTVRLKLELVDVHEQQVHWETLTVEPGIASRPITLPKCSDGLYMLVLEDAQSRLTRKVVVVR